MSGAIDGILRMGKGIGRTPVKRRRSAVPVAAVWQATPLPASLPLLLLVVANLAIAAALLLVCLALLR